MESVLPSILTPAPLAFIVAFDAACGFAFVVVVIRVAAKCDTSLCRSRRSKQTLSTHVPLLTLGKFDLVGAGIARVIAVQ